MILKRNNNESNLFKLNRQVKLPVFKPIHKADSQLSKFDSSKQSRGQDDGYKLVIDSDVRAQATLVRARKVTEVACKWSLPCM